jgi:hypothetical protein
VLALASIASATNMTARMSPRELTDFAVCIAAAWVGDGDGRPPLVGARGTELWGSFRGLRARERVWFRGEVLVGAFFSILLDGT